MKSMTNKLNLLLALMFLTGFTSFAQTSGSAKYAKVNNVSVMKTYMIERDIPGAGQFTAADLKKISQTSCGVLKEMGSKIQWVHSYVSANKIVCIYKAENEELLKEHGQKGGFPVTKIMEISSLISPATAD